MSNSDNTKQPVTGWQRSLVIGIDRFIYWMSGRWVWVFSLVAAIYVGLPMLAPVLMKVGAEAPARVIYTVYSPMCHQMASRSFFLYGEQPVYPRALADTDYTPIESYMPSIPEFAAASDDPANWGGFLLAARRWVGNDTLGYKMALCERDIAIYSFVFIGSLLYGLLRRFGVKIKPLPLVAFIILGMGPIGLDGFSQLFGQYATAGDTLAFLSNIFPLRESPPFLRTFTGALFGFSLVWMAYPHVEKGMVETHQELGAKLRKAGVIK